MKGNTFNSHIVKDIHLTTFKNVTKSPWAKKNQIYWNEGPHFLQGKIIAKEDDKTVRNYRKLFFLIFFFFGPGEKCYFWNIIGYEQGASYPIIAYNLFYHIFAFISGGYHPWDKFFIYHCNNVTMDYTKYCLNDVGNFCI